MIAAAVAPLVRPAEAEAKSRKRRRRRRRRNNQRTDPGLRLLEQLADELVQVTGDCDALTAAATEFQQEHGEELQAFLDEAAGWTPEQREVRTTSNRGRIVAAVQVLHAQLASCKFRGEEAEEVSPICEEGEPSDVPPPGEVTCSGCNCQCICPLSAGECAAQCASCFVTGDHGVCCWCGTCMDHNCSKQCENCCKL